MQSMRREIIVTNGHGTVPISALIDSPHSHSFSSLQLHISLFNFHRSVQLPKGEESLLLCSSRIWVQFYLLIYLFIFFLRRSWFSFYEFCSYCSVLHVPGSGLIFFIFCPLPKLVVIANKYFSPFVVVIFSDLLPIHWSSTFLQLLHSFSWGQSVLLWKGRKGERERDNAGRLGDRSVHSICNWFM